MGNSTPGYLGGYNIRSRRMNPRSAKEERRLETPELASLSRTPRQNIVCPWNDWILPQSRARLLIGVGCDQLMGAPKSP